MEKFEIHLDFYKERGKHFVCIYLEEQLLTESEAHPSLKAAREWAKEWCRTAGAALLAKAGARPEVVRLAYPGVEKGK